MAKHQDNNGAAARTKCGRAQRIDSRRLWPALALVVIAATDAHGQTAAPQIVRWAIEGTVYDLADPDKIFPDVRLGDAVRGTLTYDVNGYFLYPVWFGLTSMTIENPRTGQDLKLIKDIAASDALIVYFDAYPHETMTDDSLEIVQAVKAPPGFKGEAPVVEALFEGPPDVLKGEDPLAVFALDAWPIAELQFYDFYNPFDGPTYLSAEISTMTRIEAPLSPADFDYDGDVDAEDLFGWADSFGSTSVLYADANSDKRTDGADLLIWQRQLSATAALHPSSGGVPEPEALLLAAVGLLALFKVESREKTS
jgi:hypothetical protein